MAARDLRPHHFDVGLATYTCARFEAHGLPSDVALGRVTYGLSREYPAQWASQYKRRKGRETVNIVALVMRVVDPVKNLWSRRDELGASLVEYALLLALIAVVAIIALHFLGSSVSSTLNSVGSSISNP